MERPMNEVLEEEALAALLKRFEPEQEKQEPPKEPKPVPVTTRTAEEARIDFWRSI